jgi:hypothetical protein
LAARTQVDDRLVEVPDIRINRCNRVMDGAIAAGARTSVDRKNWSGEATLSVESCAAAEGGNRGADLAHRCRIKITHARADIRQAPLERSIAKRDR